MSSNNSSSGWSFSGNTSTPSYFGDSGSTNFSVNTPSYCNNSGCVSGSATINTSPGSNGMPQPQGGSIGFSFKF